MLLLGACAAPTSEPRQREANGGRYYGGVLNSNESGELRSLFPLSIVQASAHRIAAPLFEGLVRFDQNDLTIRPALAGSWEVDGTGTVYDFRLRDGVRFHDDPCFPNGRGRELTAQDVAQSLTALCTHHERNRQFWLFQDRVLGANAHYAATLQGEPSAGVKGIEVGSDREVRITLLSAWPGFLQVLAHHGCWIYPREMTDHYGAEAGYHPVGTGPFKLRTLRPGQVVVLERNAHYWDSDEFGNALPFLDALRVTFIPDKKVELEQFEKGNLSLIYELPVDRTDLLQENAANTYQVQSAAGLSVQYYAFNSARPPFEDVRVRRAFSMAIDRSILVDSVLNGLGLVAAHGLVPPGFANYPYALVPETRFDPLAARQLLAEAGYPGGRGLPQVLLQVNGDGFGYIAVAERVQSMLERHLGARVVTTVLPTEQHFDRVEHGRAQFWREGWVADHPDPENFLAFFQGRNVPVDSTQPAYLNSVRYRNSTFDSLIDRAVMAGTETDRLSALALAERRLMEDALVVPLYHERSIRLLQANVRGLPINGMEFRDLREVWFDPAVRNGR
jgi:oligopeptide transport system substrate-binding protein